jgi:hypothetical protein
MTKTTKNPRCHAAKGTFICGKPAVADQRIRFGTTEVWQPLCEAHAAKAAIRISSHVVTR